MDIFNDATDPAAVSDPEKKTILLVEDEALIALGEAALLQKHGFDVLTVHNAHRAIEAVKSRKIDLILMDIDLGRGEMDGTEAAEYILWEHSLPIVFLTSHSEKGYVEKVKKITGYGYILKNSGEFVLVETVNMAFTLFEAHREVKTHARALESTNEKLFQANALLNAALNNSQAGIAIADAPDGKLQYVNKGAVKIYGGDDYVNADSISFDKYVSAWDFKDLDGRPLKPEELPLTRAVLYGEKCSREFYLRRRDGEDRLIFADAAPIFDSRGKVQSGIVIFFDITDWKRAETALQESEAMFQQLFQTMNEGVAVYRPVDDGENFEFVDLNSTGLRLGKKSRDEVIGKRVTDVFPAVEEIGLLDVFRKVHRTGKPHHHPLVLYQDGRVTEWVENEVFALPSGLIVAIYEDTTEQKKKEAQVAFQALLLDAVGGAVIATDLQGRIQYMNGCAEELYGWDREEALGRNIMSVPGTSQKQAEEIMDLLREGKSWSGTFTVHHRDGTEFPAYVTNSPVFDDEEELIGIIGVSYDPDRKMKDSLSALKIEEGADLPGTPRGENPTGEHYLKRELYRLARQDPEIFDFLQNSSLDGIWYWDLERQDNEWMSPRFWELFGFDPTEKKHSPTEWQDLIHPDDLKVALENFKNHLEYPDHPYDQVVRYRHKDGSTVWVRCRGMAVRDDNGRPIRMLGAHNDLTELKNTEEKLMELIQKNSRTLREKEHLMKEINHRVKNNLTMINSIISLKEDADDLDLTDIKGRIDAIRIIHELLYSSDRIIDIDLKEYTENLIGTIFGSFSSVPTRFVNEVPHIRFDTKRTISLGLIINEIATNSLKHGFSPDEASGRPLFSITMKPGRESHELTLSNNGRPIPDNIELDHPETLGFQLISALVQQLEGSIEIERKPHPVFTIRFPF